MRAPETPSFPPKTVPSVASRHDPAGLGRRVTEPTIHSTPRISLNVSLYKPKHRNPRLTIVLSHPVAHRLSVFSIYVSQGTFQRCFSPRSNKHYYQFAHKVQYAASCSSHPVYSPDESPPSSFAFISGPPYLTPSCP